ncbi:hypothetical protein L7F22_041973 [Adiantum nelumboides]|nr:hypothetical protein [Adiantum nelumboides]
MPTAAAAMPQARRVLEVSSDGSGHFCTLQDAIDAVPLSNKERVIIHVAPGVYKQPIHVPKTKNMITFLGDCAETTILTWANTATDVKHHQRSEVIGTGTFACGTVIVEGEDFIAQGLTFENSTPKTVDVLLIVDSWIVGGDFNDV